MSLALRLLWRNWRAGEMRILALALLLAVTVVAAISLFTDRFHTTLTRESHSFLAADKVVRSSRDIPVEWIAQAQQMGVKSALTTEFMSMVYAGDDAMQLASVKAVTTGYPLRGSLKLSTQPFVASAELETVTDGTPARGEAWVDARLLPLLNIALGDELDVGELPLTITKIIVDEPDRGGGFTMSMGPRVLINGDDLAATQVIQPGSRIGYNLLLASSGDELDAFLQWLQPKLSVHDKVVGVENAQERLGRTLDTARRFLSLAAMISVLLAGVAIAIAARRFAARHLEQVALLKSLGSSAAAIRQLYGLQLLWLGLLASLCGMALGYGLQALAVSLVQEWLPATLMAPQPWALLPALLTGLMCLFCFAVPPLWHLPTVPPIKILRRELVVTPMRQYWQVLMGLTGLLLLVGVVSGEWLLTLSIALGLVALLLLGGVMARGLLLITRYVGQQRGSHWRLALASLQRNQQQTLIQTVVFALAITLLLSLTSLRTSLISDWQMQLPKGTPNHFLLNIAPVQLEGVRDLLQQHELTLQTFYPMVRGRLVGINGAEPDEALRDEQEALRRELNLSWAETFSKDNKLVSGVWWNEWKGEGVGVSVELQTAKRLGLQLGDQLRFSIGGLMLEATIVSMRTVDWNSMNPNFFFLFSPGALDAFSPAYMSSLYLPPEKKMVINELLHFDPTVVVIEMDRVIDQIQSIVAQVSQGVELMLLLVLVAGFLVMWAAVTASFHERQHEAALLRALGTSRRTLLGSLWLEFSIMGFMAGLMAVAASEILLLSVQYWVLDIAMRWHPELWLWGVGLSTVLVGAMGVFACRHTVTTPPGVVLRELT